MSWSKVGILKLIVMAAALAPATSSACEHDDRQQCKDNLGELVTYRTLAMERAFGEFMPVLPDKIQIKFVGPNDAEYRRYARQVAYDLDQETMIIPRHLLSTRMPKPLRASSSYWPFYQNELYRDTFPVILAVDNALWGAYLQEAAQERGLTWPHTSCGSVQLAERLPCEMLVEGVAAHLTAGRAPMFNVNRLDRIWPQDFAAFSERVWRKDDSRYIEVQRYGGWMLLKPLFDEFGVPRALFYIAQTPFQLSGNDMNAAALEYQERARESLEADKQGSKAGGNDDIRTTATLD